MYLQVPTIILYGRSAKTINDKEEVTHRTLEKLDTFVKETIERERNRKKSTDSDVETIVLDDSNISTKVLEDSNVPSEEKKIDLNIDNKDEL